MDLQENRMPEKKKRKIHKNHFPWKWSKKQNILFLCVMLRKNIIMCKGFRNFASP